VQETATVINNILHVICTICNTVYQNDTKLLTAATVYKNLKKKAAIAQDSICTK